MKLKWKKDKFSEMVNSRNLLFTNYYLPLLENYTCITVPTVWKFHDISVTQILREINFEDFRSAKFAILTHLEALKLDF